MPEGKTRSDAEARLRKELEEQILESKKWFDKIRQIDQVVRGWYSDQRVHVGGSKAPGLLGVTPSPAKPSGMAAVTAIQVIRDILADDGSGSTSL
tara:strand:- start:149 stop:433 length:285 start_codon:yes stop_codon:yes gene_type:complete